MIDVACTPPMHAFACLSISRANPHKTHFSTTMKILEKKEEMMKMEREMLHCAMKFGKLHVLCMDLKQTMKEWVGLKI